MADLKLQAQLKVLSDAYAAQLPDKLRQVEQAWAQLQQAGWDEQGFDSLHRMVHSLTGSGKTFGFGQLSDAARVLEQSIKQVVEGKTAPGEELRLRIEAQMSELRQVALRKDAPNGAITGTPDQEEASLPCAPHIFVVSDDQAQAEELRVQLSYFGYPVRVFHKLDDFRQTIYSVCDVVVLMDINLSRDGQDSLQVMTELQRGRDTPIPVIFISAHDEFDARLKAVRAGGVAYLPKPVNAGNLIDRLDVLTSTRPAVPYRVLIVDDEVEIAAYFAAVLTYAGMEVRTVNVPSEIMQPLLEFSPDLILIDLNMPGCTGMELAKVIRQLDTFLSIPIVYLSAETDLDKQLSAMSLGGDDFLTKPIQPRHLVSSVTSRIQRSQMLRSFMVRDSLTGLLNHTSIKEQLEHEIARSRRQGTPLTFAMVDIDFFKKVNDTYGHPAGDRVIKSLSRLLRQRLRENDLVGRYGGEEFAVILAGADGATAIRVLDNIRQDFSQLRHVADGKEFSSTFSCGIADIAHFGSVSALCDAADKALYQAKHAGRNQVCLADAP